MTQNIYGHQNQTGTVILNLLRLQKSSTFPRSRGKESKVRATPNTNDKDMDELCHPLKYPLVPILTFPNVPRVLDQNHRSSGRINLTSIGKFQPVQTVSLG